jgi:hypothetical protein
MTTTTPQSMTFAVENQNPEGLFVRTAPGTYGLRERSEP